MKSRPWYKRYPDNFLSGMARLTLEEKGAYCVVIDLMYARGGPIADEPRWIAGQCNCSVRKWTAIRARLIDLGKLVDIGGSLSNDRVMSVLGDAAKEAEKQRENGAKGGNKSAEMRFQAIENNGLGQASLKHIRVQNTDTPIVPKGTGPQNGYGDDADPIFARFVGEVWSKRWQRDGHNRLKAYSAYAKLTEVDRAAIAAIIDRATRHLTESRPEAKYRPMLQSWLNGRGWEADMPQAATTGTNWSAWIAAYRAAGEWNPGALGPEPGKPGCRVPREYLVALTAA